MVLIRFNSESENKPVRDTVQFQVRAVTSPLGCNIPLPRGHKRPHYFRLTTLDHLDYFVKNVIWDNQD